MLAIILLPAVAVAEGDIRQITVTGRAEVRVEPDEVILSVAVETMNEQLNVSKQENDDIVEAALEAVREIGLAAEQVKTDYMRIEPIYSSPRSADRALLGYQVTNSIVVTSQDVALVEELLTALLEAGVNRVIGVEFRSTEFRQHRDKAMLLALDAAKEKAEAMSRHLDAQTGKPLSISEGSPSRFLPSASNTVQRSPGAGEWLGGPLAPGELSIPAVVTVVFELIDQTR
jgi:uncharacterized protein YggE